MLFQRPQVISDQPRNRVLCVAKWYGAKYALGAEDGDGDFKFLRFLFPLLLCGRSAAATQAAASGECAFRAGYVL